MRFEDLARYRFVVVVECWIGGAVGVDVRHAIFGEQTLLLGRVVAQILDLRYRRELHKVIAWTWWLLVANRRSRVQQIYNLWGEASLACRAVENVESGDKDQVLSPRRQTFTLQLLALDANNGLQNLAGTERLLADLEDGAQGVDQDLALHRGNRVTDLGNADWPLIHQLLSRTARLAKPVQYFFVMAFAEGSVAPAATGRDLEQTADRYRCAVRLLADG